MTETNQADFRITFDESRAFAELSGDFNPLHLDPIAARRTQFGSTVTHGIHAVLKATDLLPGNWLAHGTAPRALTVTFHNPIRSGEIVSVRRAAADGRIRFVAECTGRPAFTMTIKMEAHSPATPIVPRIAAYTAQQPRHLSFPPGIQSGSVELGIDPGLLARLFPNLARGDNAAWIADLLASTRIVGMECPGLDSVYSGLKLSGYETGGPAEPSVMRYRIDKLDARFRLARLAVSGGHFHGTLDTFFRPPAVAQRSLASIVATVEATAYRGQKALVIGGSRGLGEIIAKLLLAGGADVSITYSRGLADAERVQAEARALGIRCVTRHMDASTLTDTDREWLAEGAYTHVYFFASPHIDRNTSGKWDPVLFARFADIYVRGFSEVIQAVVAARARDGSQIRALYPSSVFLDEDAPGFAEYCAAKAAGETLARHLAQTHDAVIEAPRLPRMRTDQTSALMDAGVAEPLPAMQELLQRFCK